MTPEQKAYQQFLKELAELDEPLAPELPELELSTSETHLECSFNFNGLTDYIASTDVLTF